MKKALSELLKAANKQQVSKKSGISRMTINRIIRKEVSPTTSTYIKLCKALGVKPSEVINNEKY